MVRNEIRDANLNNSTQWDSSQIEEMSVQSLKIEQKGPNWEGKQYLLFKSVELFSSSGKFSSGVFKTLFREHRTEIRQFVYVTARDFDLSEVHSLSPRRIFVQGGLVGRLKLSGLGSPAKQELISALNNLFHREKPKDKRRPKLELGLFGKLVHGSVKLVLERRLAHIGKSSSTTWACGSYDQYRDRFCRRNTYSHCDIDNSRDVILTG
jgi:hypothetical protein